MNRAIKTVALCSLLLLVAMIGNLTRVQVIQQEAYATDSHNQRVALKLKTIERGRITAGGEVLAFSEQGPGGLYARRYGDDAAAFQPMLGYASDIYGLSGLEQQLDATLSGKADKWTARGMRRYLENKPPAGDTVELTIDPAAQRTAYHELASRGYTGAVVAIRPSTGAILALASHPSFNPAPLADAELAPAAWEALTDDARSDKPLLNHATQLPLPPGSTFKVVVTAAALAAGKANPDTPLTGAPQITLPQTSATLENYGGQACAGGGQVPLAVAFELSCNTAFAELGMRLTADEFENMARGFGFAERPANIPAEPGTLGGGLEVDAARAQSSIGQRDVAATVLQAAMVAATVANHGTRMEPYLVNKITDPDLKPVSETKPKIAGTPITPEVADQLKTMMVAAERHAGGTSGLASKTGTAEHGENSRESNPHAWYIAFSPETDVAVAVLVENGGDRGQAATGANVAGPIGRAVIAATTNNPAREGR